VNVIVKVPPAAMLMEGDMLSCVIRVLKDLSGDVRFREAYHPSSLTVTVDDVLFWNMAGEK
jgi:hypothetical protein